MRLKILSCLFLVIATAALYSRVAHYPFIANGDDDIYTLNPHAQSGLSWKTLTWALTSTDAGYPHPLAWLSHALDFQLYGPNAGHHHLTSLLIHVLNVLILFLLLQRVTGRIGRSLLVAALFALHPLNVESVAWVAERKNVLSTLFFLLALGAYGWYARSPNLKRYIGLAALFVLALAAKPMVITLPFVLLLLDCWPLQRIQWGQSLRTFDRKSRRKMSPNRRRKRPAPPSDSSDPETGFSVTHAPLYRLVLEKVPLLVFCIGSAAATIWGQSNMVLGETGKVADIVNEKWRVPFGARMENAAYSYAMYLRDAFWPAFLGRDYPFELGYSLNAIAAFKLGLAVATIVAVSVLVWKQRRTRLYLLIGWLWYLGTLVPVIGILWMGDYSRADRYAYIPLIGIFVMIVWGAAEWADSKRVNLRLRTVPAIVMLAALSFLTWRQIGYWRSEYDMWSHAAKVESNEARANLEIAVIEARQQIQARGGTIDVKDPDLQAPVQAVVRAEIAQIEDLLKRAPRDGVLHRKLARFLLTSASGSPNAAIAEYRIAAALTPGIIHVAAIYAEIGEIFRKTGNYSSARESYAEVRKICQRGRQANPSRISELTEQFSHFVEAHPPASRYSEMALSNHIVLGIFWQESGHSTEARTAFDQAKQLDPTFDLSMLGSPSAQASAANALLKAPQR